MHIYVNKHIWWVCFPTRGLHFTNGAKTIVRSDLSFIFCIFLGATKSLEGYHCLVCLRYARPQQQKPQHRVAFCLVTIARLELRQQVDLRSY